MFLATQLMDECVTSTCSCAARARRAASRTSRLPVPPRLLQLEDFTEAASCCPCWGGTFLDLLRFVRCTRRTNHADLARRARADEARHVHFGIAHVRHALSVDATAGARLEAAVRRRAAALHGIDGVPAPIQDALTILAAGGDEPGLVARGHEAFQQLLVDMHEGRLKRLVHAGFTAEQAGPLRPPPRTSWAAIDGR